MQVFLTKKVKFLIKNCKKIEKYSDFLRFLQFFYILSFFNKQNHKNKI